MEYSHFDHVLGIAGLLKSAKPKIYLHEADKVNILLIFDKYSLYI